MRETEIFKYKPYGWGFRGDSEFWDELERRFENIKDPKDEREFNRQLEKEFNALL